MSGDKEKREAKGSKNRVYPQERPSVMENPIALLALMPSQTSPHGNSSSGGGDWAHSLDNGCIGVVSRAHEIDVSEPKETIRMDCFIALGRSCPGL